MAADFRYPDHLGVQQLDRRLGARQPRPPTVLLPAVAFTALITAAVGATWNFLSMFIVRDLLGQGDCIAWSVGQATISAETVPQRRGLNQALYNAGYSLFGVGLGTLIVTSVATSLGRRWVFPIMGLAAAVIFVALFAVIREPASNSERRRIAWRGARGLLRARSVLLITVMGCATLAWLQLSTGYNVLFLTKSRGFSLVEAGSVISVWGLVGTAGQVLLRWRRMFLADVLSSSSARCCVPSRSLLYHRQLRYQRHALLAAASGFFGSGLGAIVVATCASEAVPIEMCGVALGMTDFFAVVMGTALIPAVGGIVADHFGLPAAPWLAVGARILMVGVTETAPRLVGKGGRRRLLSSSLL